ncbi:MAG: DUF4010 domain-containing protein, partial [Proteobacteria bacterium]|nr:DUF4010 domain-containing protein [Pseudomonadota bacterium]
AATLIVLPLLPDRALGPYGALNPHKIWLVVVLVLAIGGIGHIATRALGPRYGLPVVGLASGFISSPATIGALGARAAKTAASLPPAAAGAVLSTVATVVEMAMVVGATSPPTLRALFVPLLCAGVVALGYGVAITLLALRRSSAPGPEPDQAFSLTTALAFAGLLCLVLIGSAAMRDWFGEAGVVAAAALAGFADTHAPAISTASIVSAGMMDPSDATVPILAGLTTNTLSKMLLAMTAGGRPFAIRVIPGLVLVAAAAWLGAFGAALYR